MNTGSAAVPRRILAVVVTRIGDSLLCTPALRALKARWPESRLTVWAHPKRCDVLANLPFVDRLQPLGFSRRWRSRLGLAGRFDLALVFSDDLAQIALARRVASSVVAFAGRAAPAEGLTLVRQPADEHAAVARMSLLSPLGIVADDLRLAYRVSEAERAWAETWRQGKGAPLVALQLHSFPTKAHRDWPFDHFVRFVELLCVAYPAAGFVVTGDALARPSAARLQALFGSRVVSMAGELDLRRTGALLSCVDLYVGVDTGPTHLAGALGVPMVALYHAAYPGRNLAPRQHPACTVIEHPQTGGDVQAAEMADIPPELVCSAATALLERTFS